MQLFDELKVVFIATITGVTIGMSHSYNAFGQERNDSCLE